MRSLRASATNSSSLTMTSKARRSAATRSAGTPGVERMNLPISAALATALRIPRCSSVRASSTEVGTSASSGCRRSEGRAATQSAYALDRLEQHVSLFAQRELDHALRRELRRREHHLLVGDGVIVHPQPAVLDLAARLAVRSDETRFDE